MRVHVLGGFLGAGKTTLARALAQHYRSQGESVAIITNDQGSSLVDTRLALQDADEVREIIGGCFCCRFDALEGALAAAAGAGISVAIAEAVGSCTDLIATVIAPLADRHADRYQLEPLAVVVDPWRVIEIEAGKIDEQVAYLFRKQIEEADIVLVSRADLRPPDVSDRLERLRPNGVRLAVSGATGEGIASWLAAAPTLWAAPLSIDYDRYADAEALLGWSNAEVSIEADRPFATGDVIERFLEAMSSTPVAHIKVVSADGSVRGSLVRSGADAIVTCPPGAGLVAGVRLLINARVALSPQRLEARLRDAMHDATNGAKVTWESFACFRPSRPEPRHRYAVRSRADDAASCCAAYYERPEVRYLLGDSWHPGGIDLTLRVAEQMQLQAGSRVLDVACGSGASLAAIRGRWPVSAVGLDAAPGSGNDTGFDRHHGDAHDLPFADASFDAVFCECALSTFADPARVLEEMRRVTRPAGRIAITDMVLEGDVPPALASWVSVGTCLIGARSAAGYTAMLEAAGWNVVHERDATDALVELGARIKRRLVGVALAAVTGNLPVTMDIDVRSARAALREAEAAIRDGVVRYGVFIAERPA